MISDRTANIIIGVVTTVWAANILAGMFALNGYKPAESINGIFTATVGVAFLIRARAKQDEDEDEKPKPKRKGGKS